MFDALDSSSVALNMSLLYYIPLFIISILSSASRVNPVTKDFISGQQLSPATAVGATGHSTSQLLATGLRKRTDIDEDDDLVIKTIEILTSTVPVWEAARSFERFYTTILYNVLAHWANTPLQSRIVVEMGCLQLTMTVAFDHEMPRGIPWTFVTNFARNMLAVTRCGFVGTYNMQYASMFGPFRPEFGVEVRLRVRWEDIGCHIPKLPRNQHVR